MSAKVLALALLLPLPALAQGFAGLGTDAEGFAVPQRGTPLSFPRDHGAHPEYRIEWWYLTATLTGADGRDYGIQWTLFRSALAPEEGEGWSAPQLWMGHAGLTTPEGHFVSERFARGGIGQAGVEIAPFRAWIDDWAMVSLATDGQDAYSALDLSASGIEFSYHLDLRAEGPLVPHGEEGYSVKSEEGQASYYYSQPFYSVTGTLTLPSGDVAVTGEAWLDREWSSQPLSANQEGWDWFSLALDTGERVMAFQLRESDGGHYTSGTWILPDGTPDPLEDGAIRFTPLREAEVAGRDVPVEWRVEIPEYGFAVETAPLYDRSWMDTFFAYWEGPIRFTGTHQGRGYLEMTGYE
ncbi:MAG: lipocalin-like domain-containing protein [Rubricella sp.]